jgi:hypothetical protein
LSDKQPSTGILRKRVRALLAGAFLLWLSGCGGVGGTDEDESSGDPGTIYGATTVSGAIAGQSGGQSRMSGWVVVLSERDSGISRVGEVNASGIFSIKGVRPEYPHGLTLLSPDYLVRGVFAVPSSTSNRLQMYFYIKGSTLPRFVHRGYVVSPQSTDGISLATDTVADSDGDGAPDGASSLGLIASEVDLDQDGIVNDIDPDIDGDGLLNVFDSDDDADGTLDVVDTDANGNLIVDVAEASSDQHFKAGVEYFSASVEVQPVTGGGTNTYLNLATKVRSGVAPLSVQVRGASSLLNGAVVEATDETPQAAWDKRLLDDGASEDGFSGDLIYAKKVLLGSGRSLRPNQAIFLQLGFGTQEAPVFAEFPMTFPDITLGSLDFTWTKVTRTVLKNSASDPFGTLTTYSWAVSIQNSDGVTVYESPLAASDTDSLVIPDKLLDTGSSYTMKVSAQLIDRIPGYPAFVVYSASQTFTY